MDTTTAWIRPGMLLALVWRRRPSLDRVVVEGHRPASKPGRHDDRWMVTNWRAL